ncbi:MAG: Rne/Rng family ribonuclease [Clostridia bacterium]|nr:Rne/Rng family ribonuclease [Clostridia bacterium]
MREIYIRRKERCDIAVVENGHLVEYLPEEGDASAEGIYLGKVERVVPGMKAAFIQIGQEKNGFLPLEEKNAPDMPRLQAGQSIMVQVRKEAQGVKGAYLTRDISLCGEYVLLSPLNRRIAVSARIKSESERKALKELGKRMADGAFGLVMRAAAAEAEEQAIAGEVTALWAQWEAICKTAPTAHVPSLLHTPRTLLDGVLDDYRSRGIDRIVTNDGELAQRLSDIAPVKLAGDDLMEVARITTQLSKALERRVWLDSGGTLVIDPCEAMTVIDVNTAKFTGKTGLEDTVLRLNLEACGEIARQVRLRNLSGIIIIDMIDMVAREHHQAVLEALESAFSSDRVKTVIHGFTSLGLVEMTRKRARPPLKEVLAAKQSDNR